jgi:hypothetical protein
MTIDLQAEKTRWFATLEPVTPEEMVGLWQGAGIPSGHPLDGVLENLQWFGKRFHADGRADALLFQSRPGRLVPVEPAFVPIRLVLKMASLGRTAPARNLFSHMEKRLRARGTTAKLSSETNDGVETAAMIYDRQPITDYFRRIDSETVAGMMCVAGDPRRYFFQLRRLGG